MKLDSSKPKQDRGLLLSKNVIRHMRSFARALRRKGGTPSALSRENNRDLRHRNFPNGLELQDVWHARVQMLEKSELLTQAADLLKSIKNGHPLTSKQRLRVIAAVKICKHMQALRKEKRLKPLLDSSEVFGQRPVYSWGLYDGARAT